MFSKNAPKEQVLQAAHKYFEGEQISIISSNPEKRTNTVRTGDARTRPRLPLACGREKILT